MRFILPIILLLAVGVADAQIKTFRWNAEMCRYSGTYDSKKYTAAELRDTVKLVWGSDFTLRGYPSVWKYEDIAKLDVSKLDREYEKRTAALKALQLVKVPYWENARQRKLKELDQVHKFWRNKTLAFSNPAVLREYPAPPSCAKYVEPIIAGGDDLLRVWLAVNEESRKRNGDPDRVKREFEAEYASPDRFKFAFIEVMGFGWGNCANAFLERDGRSDDGTHQKEFKKLFRRVKETYCEEP